MSRRRPIRHIDVAGERQNATRCVRIRFDAIGTARGVPPRQSQCACRQRGTQIDGMAGQFVNTMTRDHVAFTAETCRGAGNDGFDAVVRPYERGRVATASTSRLAFRPCVRIRRAG